MSIELGFTIYKDESTLTSHSAMFGVQYLVCKNYGANISGTNINGAMLPLSRFI